MVYKWNLDEIRNVIAELEKMRISLQEKKKKLKKQKEKINGIWTGIAAEQFIQNFDNDIQQWEKLSTEIEHLEGKLNIVYRDCYKKCEENVSSQINHLYMSLK